MTAELLINATPRETRVALLEDGELREVWVEPTEHTEHARGAGGKRGVVGNIYLGIVVRVLPGMQAAFIDIGLERTAFVHARDLAVATADGEFDPGPGCAPSAAETVSPSAALLPQGLMIMVLAVREPVGEKGARLTGQLSLASPNLVYLPQREYLGVSRRIQSPERREQLTVLLRAAHEQVGGDGGGGFILRTAAEHANAAEIRADMAFLARRWAQTLQRRDAASTSAPALLHRDPPLALRALRDLPWRTIGKVRIDSAETCRQVRAFAAKWMPEMPDAPERIEHYAAPRPIFDLYGVEQEITRALEKRAPLPSGGHLIFEQTEAMTTVDVNTGSFVGKHAFEETILRTNLEAVAVLARQLRLRNIGGIVIVDFIDMRQPAHRAQVMQALQGELARDRRPAQAHEMSALGLVEITRKRTGESLERLLTEPCPACRGRGVRQTAHATCAEIFREILRAARPHPCNTAKNPPGKYLVVASRAVIDRLREQESDGLADLGKFTGATIELQAELGYHQAHFDGVAVSASPPACPPASPPARLAGARPRLARARAGGCFAAKRRTGHGPGHPRADGNARPVAATRQRPQHRGAPGNPQNPAPVRGERQHHHRHPPPRRRSRPAMGARVARLAGQFRRANPLPRTATRLRRSGPVGG